MNAAARDAAPLAAWEGQELQHWCARWHVPELHVFARVASTNDVLRERALAGAPAGTTALADYQTQGRGRLGRTWEAPAGRALLFSVLLRPSPGPHPDAAGVLPLRIGLAIADAVEHLTGCAVALKWPNDVLLDGRKVAGILCESAADFVVAGIGINVGQTEAELPPELQSQATSLRIVTGEPPARPDLAGAILRLLRPLWRAPHRPLDPAELERFHRRDALAGRTVTVDDVPAGVAAGIDPLGALLVRLDGVERRVHAGTVRSPS